MKNEVKYLFAHNINDTYSETHDFYVVQANELMLLIQIIIEQNQTKRITLINDFARQFKHDLNTINLIVQYLSDFKNEKDMIKRRQKIQDNNNQLEKRLNNLRLNVKQSYAKLQNLQIMSKNYGKDVENKINDMWKQDQLTMQNLTQMKVFSTNVT